MKIEFVGTDHPTAFNTIRNSQRYENFYDNDKWNERLFLQDKNVNQTKVCMFTKKA